MRFGVQLKALAPGGWRERARRIESLGYSSVLVEDHFETQWDPATALAGIAAVTQELHVGTLVYGVDFRHPAVLAKAAATLQALSGGRHEFGIGAGWLALDYERLGIDFEPAGVRIERLEEAIEIISRLWDSDQVTYNGAHFTVTEHPRTVELGAIRAPRVLMGGGGPKVLAVAGRHADTVAINPSLPHGAYRPEVMKDMTASGVAEKIRWVREAATEAGRDPGDLEIASLAFVVAVGRRAKRARENIASSTGLTIDDVALSPLYLTGSPGEIRESLLRRSEEPGISYVIIQDGPHLEDFAEAVVQPLRHNG